MIKVHTSISLIQHKLEDARERLKGLEENIKKSIGRDLNSPLGSIRPGFKRGGRFVEEDGEVPPNKERKVFVNNDISGVKIGGRFFQGRTLPEPWCENNRGHDFRNRGSRPNPFFNPRNRMDDKQGSQLSNIAGTGGEERISVKKRLGEQPVVGDRQISGGTSGAITVFSRLSGPPKDEDMEEEPNKTIKVQSQVIVQDAPTRKEVLAAQSGDNTSKERNKRMFGALLGTLQKFRQEENKLKEKEEKRAMVERKLEEAAAREREEAKRARQELFTSRRAQQMEIKRLEYKLIRLKQLSEWESTKLPLVNFIKTKSSPRIMFLPKRHNAKTQELLECSKVAINKMIEEKRSEVEKDIEEHTPDLSRGGGGGDPERKRKNKKRKEDNNNKKKRDSGGDGDGEGSGKERERGGGGGGKKEEEGSEEDEEAVRKKRESDTQDSITSSSSSDEEEEEGERERGRKTSSESESSEREEKRKKDEKGKEDGGGGETKEGIPVKQEETREG